MPGYRLTLDSRTLDRIISASGHRNIEDIRKMAELSKQHWSAERYAATAHFVPTFGAPVVELLAPQPGEHILDLGCGDGVLTEKIAAAGAAVLGADAAPDMIEAARQRGLEAR